MTDEAGWNAKALRARILDDKSRTRYEAGSPNPAEIAAYAAALAEAPSACAVVLGMTPELRTLAVQRFDRVFAIDRNCAAIDLYRDWIPAEYQSREHICLDDWTAIPNYVGDSASAVLGDGVFGNLPNVGAHRLLLQTIRQVLSANGRFVTRMALIPTAFDPDADSATELLRRKRSGLLDATEFAFATRILGHYRCCYDAATHELDNASLFRETEASWRDGILTDAEYHAIMRYYFGGRNCIVSQAVWEEMLLDEGFHFETVSCVGRDWYRYYPIYSCRVAVKPEV